MSRTLVITGANKGIGLELCRFYRQQGDRVVAACRHASDDLLHLECEVVEGIDVSDSAAIARLAAYLDGGTVDVLFNNAGIFTNQNLGSTDFEAIEQQFCVNAMGPLRVTLALLPNLVRGSKVAMITSRMGSIADNRSGSYYGYRMSKAALNAVAKSLSIDLRDRGIAVGIYHPGFVQTSMVGFAGDISPQTCAGLLAARVEDLTIETTGQFWHSNGDSLPW